MSLLDILCGALGAFCFMMLVALPYYIPPGKSRDLRKSQEETQKLMHDLEQMKTQMRDQKSVEEMEALMRRLEAQVKALQGQLNILTAEKEELQKRAEQLVAEKAQLAQEKEALRAENEQLKDANKKLQALLQAKKPFTIIAKADDSSQGLDTVLFKSEIVEKGPAPIFKNWLSGDYDNLHTVRNAFLYGSGLGFFISSDSPPGSEAKIFVRLTNRPGSRRATKIEGVIAGDEMWNAPVRLPKVTLDPERFWIMLGTMSLDQNSRPHFQEATAAERDAAWQTLTETTPPPTPTPTPPPTEKERAAEAAQRAESAAKRVKLLAARQKFMKLMQLQVDDTGRNEAEFLQLADEILKDLPPRDFMRREVESRRDHVLQMKARREGGTPSPNNRVTPPPRAPGPMPSPTS
ncbi:MAG TPA: hypothetical protein VGL24_08705 [Chthoniobacterales bacterium]